MGPETVTAGALYVCPRSQCHRPSLLAISFYDEYGKLWSPSIRFQLPRGVAQPMDGLPEEIESVRSEAWSSYFGGDFRAALVTPRTPPKGHQTLIGPRDPSAHTTPQIAQNGAAYGFTPPR
jgi:hypothetical protein